MYQTLGYTQQQNATRILNIRGFKYLTCRYRLLKYEAIAAYIRDREAYLFARDLWREVFGAPLPLEEHWAHDLQMCLAERVSRDLFPVDLMTLTEYYNNSEEGYLLSYIIPYGSYGVAWEMGLSELADQIQPVVACIAPKLDLSELGYSIPDFLRMVDDWWQGKEYCPERWEIGQGDEDARLQALRAGLRTLSPPLDALADVVGTICRDTGNLFLDAPTGFGCEYDAWWNNTYEWTAKDINTLTIEFAQARPVVQRLNEYAAWYDGTHDAEKKVIQVIGKVMEGYDGRSQ